MIWEAARKRVGDAAVTTLEQELEQEIKDNNTREIATCGIRAFRNSCLYDASDDLSKEEKESEPLSRYLECA